MPKKIGRPDYTRCKECNGVLKKKHLKKHLEKRCSKLKKKKNLSPKKHYTSETYQSDYLLSPHWQAIKKRLYALYKICLLCSSSSRLNIHHITYKNLGAERDEDLIVVCEYCHIERIHKNKEFSKKQLKEFSSKKSDTSTDKQLALQQVVTEKKEKRLLSMRIIKVSGLPATLHHSIHACLVAWRHLSPDDFMNKYFSRKERKKDKVMLELYDQYKASIREYLISISTPERSS